MDEEISPNEFFYIRIKSNKTGPYPMELLPREINEFIVWANNPNKKQLVVILENEDGETQLGIPIRLSKGVAMDVIPDE